MAYLVFNRTMNNISIKNMNYTGPTKNCSSLSHIVTPPGSSLYKEINIKYCLLLHITVHLLCPQPR